MALAVGRFAISNNAAPFTLDASPSDEAVRPSDRQTVRPSDRQTVEQVWRA
jgi:hypothetical protein